MVSKATKKLSAKPKPTDVAIIGAGMAGIRAALALADGGHHAFLIERTVSIGGAYVAIYKVFAVKGFHNRF